MSRYVVFLLSAFMLLVNQMSTAVALDLPFPAPDPIAQYAFADQLYGFAEIRVDENGKASGVVTFSNSRGYEGDKVLILRIKLMKGEQVIHTVMVSHQLAGVTTSTESKALDVEFVRPLEEWRQITEIRYEWEEGAPIIDNPKQDPTMFTIFVF